MDTGRGDGAGEVERRLERVRCSQCGQELVFSGPRPLFCGFCGKPLGKVEPETAILPPPGPEAPTLAPFTPAAPEAGPEPAVVGGYKLVRRLGGGGMGTVYEAEDAAGRRVALKLILGGQPGSDDTLERFRREGRLASAIAHPRCVFVLAADEDAGRPYIVMELMPGDTLADLLHKRGPLPPWEAVAKIVDVLDGLREAHRLGFVHRDIKPSNCFLDAQGRVKVGDFGLSRSLVGDTRVTRTGAFLGTPLFASPEQVRGEPTGPQSDVYSLAATLYCLLTGRAPFEGGGDAASTLARIVADPVPPVRSLRPELPVALDRVVLHGLERDRQRRFRDLDEFREALLPFLPGKQDAARRSVRFAAFLVDIVLLKAAAIFAQIFSVAARGIDIPPHQLARRAFGEFVIGIACWLLYFVVSERLWGCTPGKRLLRLRVCTASGGEPPGWGSALLRFVVFYVMAFSGSLLTAPLILLTDLGSLQGAEWVQFLPLAYPPLEIAGIGLMVSTMRRRNGWRGLHEFASGTRVIQLPEPVRRRASAARPLGAALSHPANLPGRVGPFEVRGALRWDDRCRVLWGEDPSLGRSVLLWLRPASEAPLCPARRACARTTRLRWLSSGVRDGWQWDAFPAPTGRPLADLVSADGPLRWAEVRPLLEQLCDELDAASDEDTLPSPLTAGQVWVQSDGSALLFDVPLCREEGEATGGDSDTGPSDSLATPSERIQNELPPGDPRYVRAATPGRPSRIADVPPRPIGGGEAGHQTDERSLDLLARTAALALEGPGTQDPRHIRAAVPEYAGRLLDRLLDHGRHYGGVKAFAAELEASRGRPAEVTADRRAAHVVVQAALLFFGLAGTLAAGWLTDVPTLLVLRTADREGSRYWQLLEANAAAELVGAATAPGPLPFAVAAARPGADLELAGRLRQVLDQEALERQEREQAADWLNQGVMSLLGQVVRGVEVEVGQSHSKLPSKRAEEDFRSVADGWVREGLLLPRVDSMVHLIVLVTMLIGPLCWVAFAFLFRGGLSYPLMGLSLVRADGRRAGRLRCAGRALLVWAPLTALLVAAVLLREHYWTSGVDRAGRVWMLWGVEMLRWASLGLLAAYPIMAIRAPERSPADRLAGTYLVPR
jgi:uncharacterized RDD family membrane protein YckC